MITKNVSQYFGSKYLLPSIIKNCSVINSTSENSEIGNIFLFEKNFFSSIYVIEEEYSEDIIHVYSNISGYFFVNNNLDVKDGDSIGGINAANSEIVIRNIFIKRNSISVQKNSYSRYIKFIAKKIDFPQSTKTGVN